MGESSEFVSAPPPPTGQQQSQQVGAAASKSVQSPIGLVREGGAGSPASTEHVWQGARPTAQPPPPPSALHAQPAMPQQQPLPKDRANTQLMDAMNALAQKEQCDLQQPPPAQGPQEDYAQALVEQEINACCTANGYGEVYPARETVIDGLHVLFLSERILISGPAPIDHKAIVAKLKERAKDDSTLESHYKQLIDRLDNSKASHMPETELEGASAAAKEVANAIRTQSGALFPSPVDKTAQAATHSLPHGAPRPSDFWTAPHINALRTLSRFMIAKRMAASKQHASVQVAAAPQKPRTAVQVRAQSRKRQPPDIPPPPGPPPPLDIPPPPAPPPQQ